MVYSLDIETLGTTSTDSVTVIGVLNLDKKAYECHYVSPSGDAADAKEALSAVWPRQEQFAGIVEEADATAYESEADMIKGMQVQVLNENQNNPARIKFVGFYSDGFDLPMLRTRSWVVNGAKWRLKRAISRDLKEAFKYKFHTRSVDVSGFTKSRVKSFADTIDADIDKGGRKAEIVSEVEEAGYSPGDIEEFAEEEGVDTPTKNVGTLDGLYELFCDVDIADPFDDSKEAVQAYEDGRIEEVVAHNLVDLVKTAELNNIVEEMIAEREIKERTV
jgi:hypothetical protein